MAHRNKLVTSDDLELDNISETMPFEFNNEIVIKEEYLPALQKFGFKPDYINNCLKNNELNHCNASYHLLQKNQKQIVGDDEFIDTDSSINSQTWIRRKIISNRIIWLICKIN